MRMLETGLKAIRLGRVRQAPSITEGVVERKRFYDSAVWKRARLAKLNRDPMCQRIGCQHGAKHVDHWVPMALGGDRLADDNLVSLCHGHHSAKTQAEQKGKPAPFEITASSARRTSLG